MTNQQELDSKEFSDQKKLKEKLTQSELISEKLKKEIEQLKLFNQELEETNKHLVTATFRERELRKTLVRTLDELNKTKAIVENQNKRIVESINYSQKIQVAINATEEDVSNSGIEESFILYKPKDVISGDFPWFFKKKGIIYLAAVDCTGHGVPGAMMSMIGNLLLNDIMNNNQLLSPAEVLDKLHISVVNTLKQNIPGSNSNDGMDMAMCRVDLQKGELLFSGAHRPLYYLSKEGVLKEVKGDRFPIGGVQYDKKRTPFVNTSIKYKKGDSFFIFSDGLPDQIGGENKKKFLIDQVEELISKNHSKPMENIKNAIADSFDKWKGDYKQVDDVIMMGIRV